MVEEKCRKCGRERIDDVKEQLCVWCATAIAISQNPLAEGFRYNDCGVVLGCLYADIKEFSGEGNFEINYAKLLNGKYIYSVNIMLRSSGYGSYPSCYNQHYSSLEEITKISYAEILDWIMRNSEAEKSKKMLHYLAEKLHTKPQLALF